MNLSGRPAGMTSAAPKLDIRLTRSQSGRIVDIDFIGGGGVPQALPQTLPNLPQGPFNNVNRDRSLEVAMPLPKGRTLRILVHLLQPHRGAHAYTHTHERTHSHAHSHTQPNPSLIHNRTLTRTCTRTNTHTSVCQKHPCAPGLRHPRIHALIHSSTHRPIHPFTHEKPCTNPPMHPRTHALTHPCTHVPMHLHL